MAKLRNVSDDGDDVAVKIPLVNLFQGTPIHCYANVPNQDRAKGEFMRLTSWVNTHPFQLSHCAANQRQKGSYHAKSTLISRSSSRGILMSRVVPFSSACCFTPNQTIRCLHITPQLQKCSPRNQAQEREASVTLPPSNSIMYRNLLFKWRCRIR
eukprot:scaffold559_cov190-Alexandrium_tamarense.AAC.60